MRRVSLVVLCFVLIHFGTSLAADESPSTKLPVSDLIKQLREREPDKVCAAARALGHRGVAKDAVPVLEELLQSPSGRVKLAAAEALWRLEHKATDLVPVYAELLTATDADVRAASAWRLGRWGSDARPAVAVLAAALRDESLEVRAQVGQALANLGTVAQSALPALVRALGDERLDESRTEKRGWENAQSSPALPALAAQADQAIPLLIATFQDHPDRQLEESSGPQRWEVAGRVVHVFPAFGGRAVDPLLQALVAKDASTREHAARALAEIARFNGLPENAIDKLEKRLNDSEKAVRRSAASALSWARPASARAVTILEKAREASDPGDLLGDLERMSPHNPAVRHLLFRMLGEGHAETAQEAHRILAGLELPADQVLGEWTRALSHADSRVRFQAINALTSLGPHAKSVKLSLHKRLPREEDYHCRAAILDALTTIDPEEPALVCLLLKSMEDREGWVRYRAINCLEALGPKAKDALPRLEASLLNPKKKSKSDSLDDSEMRDLVDAIVRIAPGSDQTAATLLQALRDKDIRAVHDGKNSWYMRDKLEDYLQDCLPAGMPLLREALKDRNAEVRRSVALVLVRAGREADTALPVLMEEPWSGKHAYDESSRFQQRVVTLLSRRRSPLTPAVAAAWCKAWQTASPDAREILEPGLLVLQQEALPHLHEQLRKAKTPKRKRDLAHMLADFEGQGKSIVPILRDELREPHFVSQYAAAQALGKLAPDSAEAVPELVVLLGSSQPGIRAVAAQTLARMGRAAKPALPALKAMLKEARPQMQALAADALSRIDPDVSEALAFLRDALLSQKDNGDVHLRLLLGTDRIELPEGVKEDAISPDSLEECIARFGERGVLVLADVLDNVDLDEWSADNLSAQCGAPARIQAALLLARLGPDAHKAVPALIRALKDKDPFLRNAAASALARIGPAAREAAPDFITLLEEQNRSASVAGSWSTLPRGRAGSVAESPLGYGRPFDFRSAGRRHLLSRGFSPYYGNVDPYGHLRPTFPYDPAYVLSQIDRGARSALPILRPMARDSNHPGRLSAALALWRSGEDASDLLSAFADALQAHARIARDEIVPLPREMRECLTDLDTQLKPTAHVMGQWLKQRRPYGEERDRVAVVEALGRLGADARSEVDVLRPMLPGNRWNARERVAAALALFRILGDRDLVFPVLREVLLGQEEHASIYHVPDLADSARVHATRGLGVLAEKGDERASALIVETAKGDENPHVRMVALEALARRKDFNTAAIRGLCALLWHQDDRVRMAAASACGRLGVLAKRSMTALKVAAGDSQLAVRQAARQAMEAVDH